MQLCHKRGQGLGHLGEQRRLGLPALVGVPAGFGGTHRSSPPPPGDMHLAEDRDGATLLLRDDLEDTHSGLGEGQERGQPAGPWDPESSGKPAGPVIIHPRMSTLPSGLQAPSYITLAGT